MYIKDTRLTESTTHFCFRTSESWNRSIPLSLFSFAKFNFVFFLFSAYTFVFIYPKFHIIIHTVRMIWLATVMVVVVRHRVYRLECWAALLEAAVVAASAAAEAVAIMVVRHTEAIHIQAAVAWVQVSFQIVFSLFHFSHSFFFLSFARKYRNLCPIILNSFISIQFSSNLFIYRFK